MAGGPKVAILGAGSVGCFIGGAWAAAGVPVTFIGRRGMSNDVDEHGLTLSDYAGWQARLAPGDVDFRCGPEALQEAQVIALTVKSGDTAKAAEDIVRHATRGRDGHQLPEWRQQRRRARADPQGPLRNRARDGALQRRLSRQGPVPQRRSRRPVRRAAVRGSLALGSDRQWSGGPQDRRRHAQPCLGQAAHQPQQCGQCSVRPNADGGAQAARLPPRVRRLDARRARPVETRGDRAGNRGADRPGDAAADHQFARLAVQQSVS